MANAASNKDLIDHVAKETGWNTAEARTAVKATFDSVAMLLKKNERVSVTNVGSFAKKVKPSQKGGKKATNPFTGEEYVTKDKPASTKVSFRAGKGFNAHLGK
jgi:nucleoid DNA-binding protein